MFPFSVLAAVIFRTQVDRFVGAVWDGGATRVNLPPPPWLMYPPRSSPPPRWFTSSLLGTFNAEGGALLIQNRLDLATSR
ncbi:hypothetical protein BDZ89DRAFT_1138787 [Hymenopellis radicata]|nr:hypothetical protein BDZ89DRAFT_1138787 [Hymenopellis radicata]